MSTVEADLQRYLLQVCTEIEAQYPGVTVPRHARNHLFYILLPTAKSLTDVASYQDWLRKFDPPAPYREEIGGLVKETVEDNNFQRPDDARLGPLIASVLAYLALLQLVSHPCNRTVVSVSSLYHHLETEPFLHRTLSRDSNYQPQYRLETGGQTLEQSISEELLAGICSYHLPLALSITELHPAHPHGGLQLSGEEILAPYLMRETCHPLRYSATVALSDVTRDVTFQSADFVTGVRTAATWLSLDPNQALVDIRDITTQEQVQVSP